MGGDVKPGSPGPAELVIDYALHPYEYYASQIKVYNVNVLMN